MTYLERRYVRRMLVATGVAEALIVVAFRLAHLALSKPAPVVAAPAHLSLASMVALGAFPAAVCATILTSTFCRLNVIIDLLWTRPISRARLAFAMIGVDLAGIGAVWAISIVLIALAPYVLAGYPLAALSLDRATLATTFACAASLAAIYGAGIGISYSFRMQSRTLTANAWGISILALAAANVFIIPLVNAAIPAMSIAFGGPQNTAEGFAAATPVLRPIFGVDPLLGTIAAATIALTGIVATTAGWRRVQF